MVVPRDVSNVLAGEVCGVCAQVSGLVPQAAFCAMTHSKKSGADLTDAAVITCQEGATICVSGSGSVPGNAHASEYDVPKLELRTVQSHKHPGAPLTRRNRVECLPRSYAQRGAFCWQVPQRAHVWD